MNADVIERVAKDIFDITEQLMCMFLPSYPYFRNLRMGK